ncbi:PD40 domain-containing protein [Sulfidibacter corallicola]|uniref:PD40 domain-containing protein n=1 Tax=Sulfidibacter corallicola TaxID=2818388 RepID=A0A8A4TK42_SULCO|nr:winged helix-turn-helix domain-containing protein [Sulfidibacter corallicola]QTD49512.1 PD40 domain-containing protein [Sulfidibacter corallicola]
MVAQDKSLPFRLGPLTVRPDLNRIEGPTETVRLEPLVMRILVYLAEHQGRTVSREELIREIWAQQHVSDHALNRALSKLRKALGNHPTARGMIETIPKIGYRLTVSPEPLATPPHATPIEDHPPLPTGGDQAPAAPSKVPALMAGLLLLGLTTAWLSSRLESPPMPSDEGSPGYRFRPLTSLPGYEMEPSWSPDGRSYVFSHFRYEGFRAYQTDLYSGELGSSPNILLELPGDEFAPRWSPDGRQLAFLSKEADAVTVMLRDEAGQLHRLYRSANPQGQLDLEWAANGDGLYLADRPSKMGPLRIVWRSLADDRFQILTDPPAQYLGDRQPARSPDGTRLAFVRFRTQAIGDIHVLALASGKTVRLTAENHDIQGLMWLDGRTLLFSSNRAGNYSLWKLDTATQSLAYVPTQGRNATRPAPAARPGAFAYEEWKSEINVLRLAGGTLSRPIVSTHWDWQATPSPDGTRLAFLSNRSGSTELWLADGDGAEPRRVKGFAQRFSTSMSWSPDGRDLVFAVPQDGQFDLFRYRSAAEPAVQRLTRDATDERFPVFGPEGRYIYFTTNRNGSWQLMRMPAMGGTAEAVTRDGGFIGRFGARDSRLYFSRQGEPGLWRLDLAASEAPEKVAEDFPATAATNWCVTESGVVYLNEKGNMETELVYLDHDGATRRRVPLEMEIYPLGGLHVGLDGDVWMSVIDKSDSDLWLANPE